MENQKRVLKFHTGRGGRFFNPGFINFVGFEKIDEGFSFSQVFLQANKKQCFDASGNEVDFLINPNGTGFIECDTIYDTDTCVLEDELDDEQINALKRYDGYLENEVREIIQNYETV